MSDLLTAFGINWKLLVIQAVNFGLLLAVLYKFLYIPVLKILEDRRRIVEKGVTDAKAAEEALARAEAEKEAIVSHAVLESDALIKEAKHHASEEEQKILRAANERSFEIATAAERKAEEEKARVMREAEKEIAQLVVLGMEKVMHAK